VELNQPTLCPTITLAAAHYPVAATLRALPAVRLHLNSLFFNTPVSDY